MSADQAMIRAAGLSKRYGTLDALRELTLDVPRGEILALVGPNGAGKTTALKMLVGLITPTAGDAWLGGHHVLRDSVEAKQILGFVPDQPFLYEQLTVAELLGFIGGMFRMPPERLRSRVEQLVPTFGLEARLHSRIGQLSYGMKSRLILLASVLHEPQALILDEPFFGLDPQTLRLMKELLTGWAKAGMAVMLSTHQLPVVEDLAHRIAVVSHGQLVALATWEQLQKQHGSGKLEDVFFQLTNPPAA